MNWPDILLVALALFAATLYLVKAFWPKPGRSSGCGCGSVDCKVPKPNLDKAGKDPAGSPSKRS